MASAPSTRANIPVTRMLGQAVVRSLRAAHILVPLAFVVGGLGYFFMHSAGVLVAPIFAQGHPQMDLLYRVFLGELPAMLAWGCLTIPLLDASAIYVWRKAEQGQVPSIRATLNFALSRYKRMVGPHAAAYVTIMLGMVIVVPGVLFGLQYAFVDAITATDDRSQRPLARSSKLSAGRRGKIFRSWVVYAMVFYVPSQVAMLFSKDWESWPTMLGLGTLDMFLLAIMEMVMFALYQERIDDARRAQEAKEAREAAAVTVER